MGNALEFLLKLQDMLTPGMRQAARISNSTASQIQSEFDKISGGGKRMAASVNELKQRLDAINRVRFGTTVQKEFDIATRAAINLERQIAKLKGRGRSMGSGGGFTVGKMVKGTLIASGIQQAGGFLLNQGKDIYNTTLGDMGLKTAINATTKGRGDDAVKMTKSISQTYGLNYEASLEGVRTLTGGLMGMNMTLEDQMKIFKGVSTGVAAMKLSSEQAKGAFLALGQMASKGTVSAEELRGQLGERIPGAFSLAAQAMGVTEAKLNKMLQQGEIASKDFLPRFAAQMEKTFGKDALDAATGPQAVQERWNNAIYNMQTTIGSQLMPIITPVIERLTQLAESILPYIQGVISNITSFVNGIANGTGRWSEYTNVVRGYAMSVWNTIKSIAGNIWNIVGGIIDWLSKSELVKDLFWVIGKLADGLLWVVRKVGDALEWIWKNVIKPIVDAIETAYRFVKWVFGSKSANAGDGPKLPGTVVPMTTSPLNFNDSKIKSQSDSINSGGQRSIVINIGKQIENLEIHVMSGKETAEEIESIVRESMRRIVYSLNQTGS